MFSKPLAVGALAAGCVAAAAGGAYVAVRHNEAPAPSAVSASVAPTPAVDAAKPVAETEAIVTPAAAQAPAATPVPLAVPEPAPPAPRPSAARSAERPAPDRSRATAPRPQTASVPSSTSPRASTSSRAPEPRADASVPASPREAREPVAEAPVTATTPTAGRADVDAAAPRPEVSAPPQPQFEELVVPASSVIGLQVETPITTERARLEDRVDARITRDVLADGRVAIPAGARAIGTVMLVERGGKVKERARLGVRFHTLVLADGTEVPINTEAIYREGESPAGESSRKIGGAAIGGAILGALIGGKKGAVVGGATGAAGGTAVVMAGDRNAATLPSGTIVTIRLAAPVAVEVEKR